MPPAPPAWRRPLLVATLSTLCTGAALQTTKLALLDAAPREFKQTKYEAAALFLLPFGVGKAMANLLAGWLAAQPFRGTAGTLTAGWLTLLALPLALLAQSWSVLAMLAGAMLGAEQGLTWSASLLVALNALGSHARSGVASGWIETVGYTAIAAMAGAYEPIESATITCSFQSGRTCETSPTCSAPLDWKAECADSCSCRGYTAIAGTSAAVAASVGLVLVALDAFVPRQASQPAVATQRDDLPLLVLNPASVPSSAAAVAASADPAAAASTANTTSVDFDNIALASPLPVFRDTFVATSFADQSRSLCCISGFVLNLNTGLAWGLLLSWLRDHAGLTGAQRDAVAAFYSFPKGMFQVFAGALSDWVGRRIPITLGLGISAAALFAFSALARQNPSGAVDGTNSLATQASVAAAALGFGTALAYPVLAAAVAERAGTGPATAHAVGTFRFWRDLGYAAGTLVAWGADAAGPAIAIAVCAAISLMVALAFACRFRNVK